MANRSNSKVATLWFVTFVVIGVTATEFYGPYRNWLSPTANKLRNKITDMKHDYDKRQKEAEERRAKDEKARKIAERQQEDRERIARRTRVIGLKEFPRTAMMGVALVAVQTDGEVTPADLPMQLAKVPAKKRILTVGQKFMAKMNGKKVVFGSDEYKELYKQLYEQELAQLSKPKMGEVYTVSLKNDQQFEGTLKVLGKDLAAFALVDSTNFDVKSANMHNRSLKTFFPEQYAKKYATYYLSKVSTRPIRKVVAKEKQEPVRTVAAIDSGSAFEEEPVIERRPVSTRIRLPELTKYDPTPAKTPRYLAKTILFFGNWIEAQGNHQGGRMASKLYAKIHGKQVVLYMKMTPFFLVQSKSVRRRTTEQFWHMWVRECMNRGKVKNKKQAHIVILDGKNHIVGGSRERDSENIWAK